MIKSNPQTSLTDAINELIELMANGSILKTNNCVYTKHNIFLYTTARSWLEKYQAVYSNVSLQEIDIAWVEEFIVFLTNNNLKQSWIYRITNCFKLMLKRWEKIGLITFNPKKIEIETEYSTPVYNTLEELDLLLDLDLSNEPVLELTRDVYILQSYIGLRYSDLKTFLKDVTEFIRKDGKEFFFEIPTRKTGTTVALPIAEIIKPILKKYKYKIKVRHLADYNQNIRLIAERAGITDQVVITWTQGGTKTQKVCRKCDIMSSHTARRNFATNALLSGLSHIQIMFITGHASYTSLLRYLRCSAKEIALKISSHSFFNDILELIQPANTQKLVLKKHVYVSMPKPVSPGTQEITSQSHIVHVQPIFYQHRF